ncbi:MAG: phosphotransferase [Thermodesulfobacteriota bacterium]|nr:phosphotransferase [Thermodesulfobacteriota bacterium]
MMDRMEADLKKSILDFLRNTGVNPRDVVFHRLQPDGSIRLFWRITSSEPRSSFIVMINPPSNEVARRENFAYVMIGKHLHQKGIPVPKIYMYNLELGWVFMEDMGQKSLQDVASSNEDFMQVYEKVLEHLLVMQIEGAKDFDPAWCCQTEKYDRVVMRQYEANYFRDAFLCLYLGLKKEWPELEGSFNHLSETGSGADSNFFLHRDFQSRNIMVSKSSIGFIDWQGGRLGPLGYDLASLIIDPYPGLSSDQRDKVYETYSILIKEHNAGSAESFERYFPYLAIQRNLQILGAFSFLTKIRNKPKFEAYIPAALKSLDNLLYHASDQRLSPLRDLVRDLQPEQKNVDTSN